MKHLESELSLEDIEEEVQKINELSKNEKNKKLYKSLGC